jgi:hypothetical protein
LDRDGNTIDFVRRRRLLLTEGLYLGFGPPQASGELLCVRDAVTGREAEA